MKNYYSLLHIESNAHQADVDAAYARQRKSYDPDRVSAMDADMQQIAEQRIAELDYAYSLLSDPERRHQYDVGIGLASAATSATRIQARRRITPRERTYAVVGLLLACVLITAVWLFTGRSSAADTPDFVTTDRPAPAFVLPALDGGTVDLADYDGDVILVNFWGTWCEPCQREMPALQSAHNTLADQGLVVIGVNLADDETSRGNTQQDIANFIEQYGVTYPVALDLEGDVTNDYRVFPLPTSFFIDAQGRIRYVHVGELTLNDITTRFNILKQDTTARRSE